MKPFLEDAAEQIDAAFYTGDSFHSAEDLDDIEAYIARWSREAYRIREMLEIGPAKVAWGFAEVGDLIQIGMSHLDSRIIVDTQSVVKMDDSWIVTDEGWKLSSITGEFGTRHSVTRVSMYPKIGLQKSGVYCAVGLIKGPIPGVPVGGYGHGR